MAVSRTTVCYHCQNGSVKSFIAILAVKRVYYALKGCARMHNRIAEVRNQQGLTLIQLAKKIGVSDGTISRYETGDREPKLDTWQKLADVIGVSVPYLQGV